MGFSLVRLGWWKMRGFFGLENCFDSLCMCKCENEVYVYVVYIIVECNRMFTNNSVKTTFIISIIVMLVPILMKRVYLLYNYVVDDVVVVHLQRVSNT